MITLYELNDNIPESLSNFYWDDNDDRLWTADWTEDIHMEGESVDAEDLEIGDVVICYNGLYIDCVGRVVDIEGFGRNVYRDHLTFDYYLDMEHPRFCNPFFTYTHENSGITVVRKINDEEI